MMFGLVRCDAELEFTLQIPLRFTASATSNSYNHDCLNGTSVTDIKG